jgi:mannose-6-phosphate isomerase-like protein (cupin superfamily)
MQEERSVIRSKVLKQEITFLGQEEVADSPVLKFRQVLEGNGAGWSPQQIHFDMDETFEVLEGTVEYRLFGQEKTATVGEKIFVPRGYSHQNPYNAGANRAVLLRTQNPEGGMEAELRQWFRMADEGKTDARGRLTLLQRAVNLRYGGNHTLSANYAFMPQRLFMGFMGIVGRLLGKKPPSIN